MEPGVHELVKVMKNRASWYHSNMDKFCSSACINFIQHNMVLRVIPSINMDDESTRGGEERTHFLMA